MPDSQDYKSAMDKVTAGQRWKQATLEKMQAQAAAQKAARPRRTIPFGPPPNAPPPPPFPPSPPATTSRGRRPPPSACWRSRPRPAA